MYFLHKNSKHKSVHEAMDPRLRTLALRLFIPTVISEIGPGMCLSVAGEGGSGWQQKPMNSGKVPQLNLMGSLAKSYFYRKNLLKEPQGRKIESTLLVTQEDMAAQILPPYSDAPSSCEPVPGVSSSDFQVSRPSTNYIVPVYISCRMPEIFCLAYSDALVALLKENYD